MTNESGTSLKCQQWIKLKGKEKIQSFQDSFADLFNISLCLLSLDGKALTVWSNSSLFCDCLMKKNYERCIQERQKIIQHVKKNKASCIFTCYMGLTSFACPIFHDKELIGLCIGGDICLEENNNSHDNKICQHVTVVSERKLKDIIKMLESIFNMCNIDENAVGIKKHKKIESQQELLFLQRKLSRREFDIVKLIIYGLTNKEIAEQLYISEKTVKAHVSNILKKLKLKNRMQIIILCNQNNMQ